MASLTALLLLTAPLPQLRSLATSMKNCARSFQRAGSTWASAVCEERPFIGICVQLGIFKPFRAILLSSWKS
jgi:hypothetical protein